MINKLFTDKCHHRFMEGPMNDFIQLNQKKYRRLFNATKLNKLGRSQRYFNNVGSFVSFRFAHNFIIILVVIV